MELQNLDKLDQSYRISPQHDLGSGFEPRPAPLHVARPRWQDPTPDHTNNRSM